jgi:hypothetical protein
MSLALSQSLPLASQSAGKLPHAPWRGLRKLCGTRRIEKLIDSIQESIEAMLLV